MLVPARRRSAWPASSASRVSNSPRRGWFARSI